MHAQQFASKRYVERQRDGGRHPTAGIGQHDVAQVRTLHQHMTSQQAQALRRGDQHAHVAVAQDVADLLGLEQRIHRHERTAGAGRAEAGDHRFEALVEVDADPFAALQAQTRDAAGEAAVPRSRARRKVSPPPSA